MNVFEVVKQNVTVRQAAARIGASLITEADVLAAAQSEQKTLRACVGAIITPAARDALLANDIVVQYEGETVCS